MTATDQPFVPAATLLLAVALDLGMGEPPGFIHPVVWMGRWARWLERRAPRAGKAAQLVAGGLIVVLVAVPFALLAFWAMRLAARVPAVEVVVGALLLKPTFAWRALGAAGLRMRELMSSGDVEGARLQLRSLCSRDPSALEPPALAAATVESLAENASDSVVAPLLYFVLFGVPGAVFYRAVNTLDAMIGYRGRYEYLGKAAARLDDLLNLVPARLTATLLLLSGTVAGTVRNGWRILMRDGAKTASPNAGRPMAAMAGLLRVELTKDGHYRLGDAERPITSDTITEAWRLARLAVGLATVLALVTIVVRHGIAR